MWPDDPDDSDATVDTSTRGSPPSGDDSEIMFCHFSAQPLPAPHGSSDPEADEVPASPARFTDATAGRRTPEPRKRQRTKTLGAARSTFTNLAAPAGPAVVFLPALLNESDTARRWRMSALPALREEYRRELDATVALADTLFLPGGVKYSPKNSADTNRNNRAEFIASNMNRRALFYMGDDS